MTKPILVLQYFDSREGRTVAVAATRNPKVLRVFKEVVLEDARLAAMDLQADDVLLMLDQMELGRLEKLLGVLIPSEDSQEQAVP